MFAGRGEASAAVAVDGCHSELIPALGPQIGQKRVFKKGHSNSGPRRGVVLTGMDARVPARLKDVNDGLHADVELGHPHHPEPALRVLHETHLSARLQGNTFVEICRDLTGVSTAVGAALPGSGTMLVQRAALNAGGCESSGPLRWGTVALTRRPERRQKLPARHTFGLFLTGLWRQDFSCFPEFFAWVKALSAASVVFTPNQDLVTLDVSEGGRELRHVQREAPGRASSAVDLVLNILVLR